VPPRIPQYVPVTRAFAKKGLVPVRLHGQACAYAGQVTPGLLAWVFTPEGTLPGRLTGRVVLEIGEELGVARLSFRFASSRDCLQALETHLCRPGRRTGKGRPPIGVQVGAEGVQWSPGTPAEVRAALDEALAGVGPMLVRVRQELAEQMAKMMPPGPAAEGAGEAAREPEPEPAGQPEEDPA
jgi:hypothetical protein